MKYISFVHTVDSILNDILVNQYSAVYGGFWKFCSGQRTYCIVLMFFENAFLDYLTNLEKKSLKLKRIENCIFFHKICFFFLEL